MPLEIESLRSRYEGDYVASGLIDAYEAQGREIVRLRELVSSVTCLLAEGPDALGSSSAAIRAALDEIRESRQKSKEYK